MSRIVRGAPSILVAGVATFFFSHGVLAADPGANAPSTNAPSSPAHILHVPTKPNADNKVSPADHPPPPGPNTGSGNSGKVPIYTPFPDFAGSSCLTNHSNPTGNDHTLTIVSQKGSGANGTVAISVDWKGTGGGGGGGQTNLKGSITQANADAYAITFSWTDGIKNTNTYNGTISYVPPLCSNGRCMPEVPYWTLNGGVTVTTKQGKVIATPQTANGAGQGPGVADCISGT